MPYPPISSRRIPYDINGTAVGYGIGFLNGINTWFSSEQLISLNNNSLSYMLAHGDYYSTKDYEIRMFFPEKYEIENICVSFTAEDDPSVSIKGSNDTANGVDGTWESAAFPNGAAKRGNTTTYWWRINVLPVSFSTAYKTICIRIPIYYNRGTTCYVHGIHLYGRKASNEAPDDILFCNASTGDELTALTDWGDRPEGTTVIKSFKVKNASTTKIANNVNLQLNHADFLMSFSSSGPWQATLDISSIPANSLSAEIFVKNTLGPPLLALGPKAARVIASVGSWT